MKDELIKFIQGELTYDATARNECKKCGHYEKDYWIDHRDSLASNIATKLGLKTRDIIKDILDNVSDSTQGKSKADAIEIVDLIDRNVMALS